MIITENSQCTAVLHSDWSLQMTKMTLDTQTMSGDDFPGALGVLRGSNSVHHLISDIYWQHKDTVYCSRKGGRIVNFMVSESSYFIPISTMQWRLTAVTLEIALEDAFTIHSEINLIKELKYLN